MNKNIVPVILVVLALAVGWLFLQENKDTKDTSFGSAFDAATFKSAATSGAMTIGIDEQILASSTARTNAIVCNDSAQVVYLGLDQDNLLLEDGSNQSLRLNANGGCFEINENNLYQGAIRASSTNETESRLIISEYVGK